MHPAPPSEPPVPPLPAGWNPSLDLLVLVGRGAGPLVRRMAARGQERILVWLPEGAAEDLPAPARTARDAAELFEVLVTLGGRDPDRATLARTDDPWATAERQRDLAGKVQEALQSRRIQRRTVERFGPDWLLQAAENLPAIAGRPSIAALAGAFAGRPCVLVSPGPSLSKNLGLLRELRGKALLVTGTHALAALESAGVAPDLVVVSDPGDLGRHYAGLDVDRVSGFVIDAVCRREHFALPARRSFAFATSGPIDEWVFDAVGERARLSSGGSVACSAFSLAVHLGCDRIALVGQDLALDGERYYAAESLDGDARIARGPDGSFQLEKPPGSDVPGAPLPDGGVRFTVPRATLTAPGYHGGEVVTTEAFQAFRTWFQACASAERGRTLWNCTEGGAAIEGFEPVPLARAVTAWADERLDAGAVLDRACAGFDPAERRRRFAARARAHVTALEECGRLAGRCRALAGRLERRPERADELRSLEGKLSRALRPVRFLSLIAQAEIAGAQARGRNARTVAENLAAAAELHGVVERAARTLADPLRAAWRELESGSAETPAQGPSEG